MATFSLKINGKTQQVDVAPDTPMLWVLRDHVKLVGTKVWMRRGSVRCVHRSPR